MIAFLLRRARAIALIGGCVALGIVAAATLSPIALRPTSSLPVDLERGLAFAIVGVAFSLANPRRPMLVLVAIVACAASLEWLQNVLPDRHGRLDDFFVKAFGAGVGVGLGLAVNYCIRRYCEGRT